jgi:hypothetical protein
MTKYGVQQKEQWVNQWHLCSGAPDCPVCHRTVSGAPPDSVRCTRGLQLKLVTFGNIQRRSAIIHRTVRCTPDSVRCSKEERPQELASFGNSQRLVRYNSPDMSGVHRTVRCAIEATDTSAPMATCSALNARQKSGTPILAHQTLYSTCPVRHRTSRRAQKTELQRSEPNGFGDVAGAHHTTVSPTKRLVWWLGL